MRTVNCSLLLAQDTPNALVLAILCDFKDRPAQDIINYIVLRLKELTADDEGSFRNYFEMLETLADNRDLQPQLDEAKQMLTEVNIKKFASYNWGYQDGVLEGKMEGKQEGEKQHAEAVALKLLSLQSFDLTQIADISGLSLAEVEALQKNPPKPH